VLDPLRLALLAVAFGLRAFEMADRGGGGRGDRRRKGGCEDEARREGPDGVDDGAGPGDVAAERAEGLGQRSLDDVDAVGETFAFGYAAAARAIHADRVYLVDIGHRIVAFRQIGDRGDGC